MIPSKSNREAIVVPRIIFFAADAEDDVQEAELLTEDERVLDALEDALEGSKVVLDESGFAFAACLRGDLDTSVLADEVGDV